MINNSLFRKDINGLRAWAVIFVILFHFSLIGLHSGFIGVDIFFVISGYLMTSIIVNKLLDNRFKIFEFWLSRIRRILPALLVVIIILILYGWFVLPNSLYNSLIKETIASIAFVSNIFYWKTSGYFDNSALDKYLLHTWSLGIEAQFYFLYPIFLIIIYKIFKSFKILILSIIFLLISSFVLNIIFSPIKSVATFYLLPTRIWEFLVGGLIFFIEKRQQNIFTYKKLIFYIGLIIISIGLVFINEQKVYPSYYAILPVIGTAFIILSNSNNFLLSNRVMQYIGARSYSLYLWHWIFVVFLYKYSLSNDILFVLIGISLSFILSDLSYQYIETPTRKKLSYLDSKKEFILYISILVVFIFIFYIIKLALINNIDRLFISKEKKALIENIEKFGKGDKLSDSKGLFSTEILNNGSTLLLLGDSHAGASSKIIEDLSKKYNWNFSLFNQGGCPLIENVIYTRFGMEKNRGELDCKNYVYTLLKESKLADKVLVINRMPYYFYGPNEVGRENFFGLPLFFFNNDKIYEEYNDEYINKIENSYIKTLCDIRKKTNKMYITRPIPEISVSVPTSLIKQQSSITFEDIKIKKSDYIKRNKRIWEIQDLASKQCDIKIIDPTEYLCDDSFCYGSIEGKPLYFDDNHLGIFGNKVIFDTFKNIYND